MIAAILLPICVGLFVFSFAVFDWEIIENTTKPGVYLMLAVLILSPFPGIWSFFNLKKNCDGPHGTNPVGLLKVAFLGSLGLVLCLLIFFAFGCKEEKRNLNTSMNLMAEKRKIDNRPYFPGEKDWELKAREINDKLGIRLGSILMKLELGIGIMVILGGHVLFGFIPNQKIRGEESSMDNNLEVYRTL